MLFPWRSGPICGCKRRMVRLKMGIPIYACRCGALKVGEHTITMNGSLLSWSDTGTPTAAGHLGMSVTTGRPMAFIGGVAQSLATTQEVANAAAKYVGSIGIDETFDLPSLASGEQLLIFATAQWVPTATGQRIRMRLAENGSFSGNGFYGAIWASDTALTADTNVNGIPVIWTATETTERRYYAFGALWHFGGSGVRYLGLSEILNPADGAVNVLRVHGGWKSSMTTPINKMRFERSGAPGPVFSFTAQIWHFRIV